jgi:hypothetical protein
VPVATNRSSGPNPGRILRLLIRIPSDKRQELLQSLRAFGQVGEGAPTRVLILQDIDDADRVCWIGDWSTAEDFDAFTTSEVFAALRGAARVLGDLEEVKVLDETTRSQPSPGRV